jgi:hypothetical protein
MSTSVVEGASRRRDLRRPVKENHLFRMKKSGRFRISEIFVFLFATRARRRVRHTRARAAATSDSHSHVRDEFSRV